MKWKMEAPCKSCPWNANTEEGRHMRKSLRGGRLREIENGLLRGDTFHCHNTVDYSEDDEGNTSGALLCAGALAWQNARGASSNLQRVMESLEYFANRRAERSA